MSLKTFFAKIGAWFKGLFSAAEKAWDKISPALQDAFLKGSGIVAEINKYAGETPDIVYAALEAKYPDLTKEQIAEALAKAANVLNVGGDAAASPDIYDVLTKIQAQLDKTEGKDWAKKSSMIAKIIAHFFAPEGTKSSIFELLMEFVFQKLVKK
jgi:hypothetical protein